jgi:hypothetical protein
MADRRVTARISAVSDLETLLGLIEPHPELVAATVPTSRQVAEAAGRMGLLSEDRWFRPAVSADRRV